MVLERFRKVPEGSRKVPERFRKVEGSSFQKVSEGEAPDTFPKCSNMAASGKVSEGSEKAPEGCGCKRVSNVVGEVKK